MRKLMKTLLAVLLVFGLSFALAEDVVEDDAGLAPDSMLYGLDKAFDKISLALTFNKVKKAEKGLRIAQERLMESKIMAEKGKLEYALEAQEEYGNSIETVEGTIEGMESDDDPERAREAIRNIAQIQNRIENHYQKVTEVKDSILERQRERMSEEQIAKIEQVFNRIKAKAMEMETKTELKRERVKIKYKALSEKTDTEIENEMEEIDEDTGLSTGRIERAENEIKKAEIALIKSKEKIVEEKLKGVDVSVIERQIEEIEEQLEYIKEMRNSGKNTDIREISEGIKDFGNEISVLAKRLGDAKEEGNFDEIKLQIQEKISERHMEHIGLIQEKVSEYQYLQRQMMEQKEEDELASNYGGSLMTGDSGEKSGTEGDGGSQKGN